MKAVVVAFNLVGAFSVIIQLHRLIDRRELGDRREMCRDVRQQPATYLEAIMGRGIMTENDNEEG